MKLLKTYWPIILLLAVETVLFIATYIPGTYLIGWDNVMPEFNIGLNFKRALFSVWQDYRGLGLLDGMAHAANLAHTIYISLLSLVLPQNLLRYTFIILTHLVGGIGIYFLIKKILTSQGVTRSGGPPTSARSEHAFARTSGGGAERQDPKRIIALLVSLFYMFNIGVIQMFYAPLEVFAFHFAALPFLALWIKNALDEPKVKNLFILFLTSVIFSSQGFVPTVFAAFLILLFSFLLSDFFTNRNLKKIILVTAVIFSANAFWLLPYSYSAIKTPGVIQNSRINQFSSEEAYLRNRAQGSIEKVLSMRGFMLDSIEYDARENQSILFMQQWRSHYDILLIKVILVILFSISLLGIAYTISNNEKGLFPYLISISFSFFLLANDTPIFVQINDLIRLWFPPVGEALRFPFTKFIILFAFSLSVFLAVGISFLTDLVRKTKFNVLVPTFYSLAIISLFLIALPAFKGYFFSPLLKAELPNEYREIFSYFSSEKSKRIAMLPAHSFWNWQYRNWGHIGSGFLWYGIKQPILDRAFDPWSLYNEQFYNEVSYAINKDDVALFEKVLEKYDVEYLLLDKTILNSISREPINYPALENFLESSENIVKERTFGRVFVYKIKDQKSDLSLTDSKSLKKVSPGFHFTNRDIIYENLGQYIKDDNNPNIIFLLPSFYSGKLQENLLFEAENRRDSIIIRPKFSFDGRSKKNYTLELKSLFENEFIIPVEIKITKGNILITPIYPKILINEGTVIAPQEETITLTPNKIQDPSSIEIVDIGDEIKIINGVGKAFILNNYINVLKLKSAQGEELVILNTQNIASPVSYIPLPNIRIEKIEILIDKFESALNIENVIQKRLYQIKYKPDPLKIFPGDIFTNIEEVRDGVVLKVSGNSSADISFYQNNLPHQGSYLMFIDSEYKSGLPINFYIDSVGPRLDLETKLAKKNNKNIIFIPQTESAFKGYGFHFIVKSVGREHAQSKIKNIRAYPIPADTINSMRIRFEADTPKNDSVTLNKSNKINPSIYSSEISGNSSGKAIVLSQAFDPGWKAYAIANSQQPTANSLKMALPFLFGDEIKEHVEVNGWANGWLLPKSVVSGPADTEVLAGRQLSVVIVYLPQYLEYAGFVILITTFGVLLGRFLFLRQSA